MPTLFNCIVLLKHTSTWKMFCIEGGSDKNLDKTRSVSGSQFELQ